MFSSGPYMNCKWSGTCGFANSSMPQPIWRAKFQDFEGTATQVPTGMTYARTGVTWDYDSAGTMKQFASGVLPIGYDPITHEPIGALVEGGATNYIPHYDITNETYWGNERVSISTTGAPLDSKGRPMVKIIEDSTASNSHSRFCRPYTYPANSVHCFQVEVKPDTRTNLILRVTDSATVSNGVQVKFDITNRVSAVRNTVGTGAYLASGFVEKANGNVVCWMLCTIDAASTSFYSYIYLSSTYGTVVYSGDGTSGLWVSLPQNAPETTPSSHIDTTGAAASRVRSDLILPLPQPGFSTDRGTFVCDFVCPIIPGGSTTVAVLDMGITDSNNCVRAFMHSNGRIYFQVWVGGTANINFNITVASIGAVAGKRIRLVFSWLGTSWWCVFGSVGGTSASAELSSSFPTTNRMLLGQYTNGTTAMFPIHFLDAFFLPYAVSAQQRQLLAKVA